ncbi:MAG: sulfite exporter TauE/SafE family protein [Myxococcota bacterium]
MLWLLPALGLAGGMLTTVAGIGGGLMMVLVLSAIYDPAIALATTSPALLLGNSHRFFIMRRGFRTPEDVEALSDDERAARDRRPALMLALGALPGAFAGALLAISIPTWVLTWLLLAVAVFAVARPLGLLKFRPGGSAFLPGGVLSGAVTATSGGGGLVIAPILLGAGVRGETYIASTAVIAVAMHIGRIPGYGLGGWFTAEILLGAGLLALALFCGNSLGKWIRGKLSERTSTVIAYSSYIVLLALAVLGVT